MAFPKLFDDPLFGDHCALVLGWDDDQLKSIVDLLAPWLPDNLSEQMRLAVAGVARSIVVEEKRSGRGVHYARGKEPYRRPKRYRDGGPRFTWYYVKGAMDLLLGAGLIEHKVGLWCPGHKGFQSVAWATDKLITLLEPLIDPLEPRGIPRRIETIILRDRADKNDIDYVDTAEIVNMRDQLGLINHRLAQLELRHRGQYLHTALIRRIFNGDFDRGGRLYCHGNSFQNMPSEQRREIEFINDGTAYPAVEVDYASLHPQVAYSKAGRRVPPGDPYLIDGFDRGLVKLAVNILFNASTTKRAVNAIAEDLHTNRGATKDESYPQASKVVAAIRRKHYRIEGFFGSDCGARFQRQDSDMAVKVLTKMIERTGRCPLPMHDSFLVPEVDADVLTQTMTEVAGDYGLRLDLKVSWGLHSYLVPSHAAPYSTMEVTTPDLREQGRRVWWTWALFTAHKEIVDTSSTALGVFVHKRRPRCHGPPALSVPNGSSDSRIAFRRFY
jgi:hypothetical protein